MSHSQGLVVNVTGATVDAPLGIQTKAAVMRQLAVGAEVEDGEVRGLGTLTTRSSGEFAEAPHVLRSFTFHCLCS